MTDAELYGVVVSTLALLASVFVGWRQRQYETKVAKYELEDRERERAARQEAAVSAAILREGRVTLTNYGHADAVDVEVLEMEYPNTSRIDPAQGVNVITWKVGQLDRDGGEAHVPFFYLRGVAVPPLKVKLRWVDEPTGRAREKAFTLHWQ